MGMSAMRTAHVTLSSSSPAPFPPPASPVSQFSIRWLGKGVVVNAKKARGLKPLDSETRTVALKSSFQREGDRGIEGSMPNTSYGPLGPRATYPSMYDLVERKVSSLARAASSWKFGRDMVLMCWVLWWKKQDGGRSYRLYDVCCVPVRAVLAATAAVAVVSSSLFFSSLTVDGRPKAGQREDHDAARRENVAAAAACIHFSTSGAIHVGQGELRAATRALITRRYRNGRERRTSAPKTYVCTSARRRVSRSSKGGV